VQQAVQEALLARRPQGVRERLDDPVLDGVEPHHRGLELREEAVCLSKDHRLHEALLLREAAVDRHPAHARPPRDSVHRRAPDPKPLKLRKRGIEDSPRRRVQCGCGLRTVLCCLQDGFKQRAFHSYQRTGGKPLARLVPNPLADITNPMGQMQEAMGRLEQSMVRMQESMGRMDEAMGRLEEATVSLHPELKPVQVLPQVVEVLERMEALMERLVANTEADVTQQPASRRAQPRKRAASA
jgi:hypothetical protein